MSRESKHGGKQQEETAQLDTKRFLTKVNARGVSVHDHLTQVLLKIGKDKPSDALGAFEDISASLKTPLEVALYAKPESSANDQLLRNELKKSVEQNSLLVAGPPKGVDDEEMEVDPDSETVCPDILGLAEKLRWAGVNLGKTETFKLVCSIDRMIKSLALLENPETPTDLRFWGKIHGLKNDYWIVEGKLAEPADMPEEVTTMEMPGMGVNEHVYYVTTSLTGEWTRLPWCTPEMIQTTKSMRRYFTGDLKAPVLGFPRFPWGEAAYLRAQIARISASTMICPKEYWEAGEDDEANILTKTEGWEAKATGEMALFENWVHYRGFLLNSEGRVTNYVNEEEPEDEESDQKAKPKEEKEDPIPLLQPIDLDLNTTGRKIWSVRASPSLVNAHCVVSMHNFNWPGAIAIFQGSMFENVYVGWGHKYMEGPYSPPPPPAMALEYDVAQIEEGQPPLEEQVDPPPKLEEEKSQDEEQDEEDD